MKAIFEICRYCKYFFKSLCLQRDSSVGDDGTCQKFSLSPKYKVTGDETQDEKEKD